MSPLVNTQGLKGFQSVIINPPFLTLLQPYRPRMITIQRPQRPQKPQKPQIIHPKEEDRVPPRPHDPRHRQNRESGNHAPLFPRDLLHHQHFQVTFAGTMAHLKTQLFGPHKEYSESPHHLSSLILPRLLPQSRFARMMSQDLGFQAPAKRQRKHRSSS